MMIRNGCHRSHCLFGFICQGLLLLLLLGGDVGVVVSAADGDDDDCSDNETVLHFENATVPTSTLQDVDGELRFNNVGTYYGDGDDNDNDNDKNPIPIDLVVKQVPGSTIAYIPTNVAQNRLNGYYGMINVNSQDGAGEFQFCFMNSQNQETLTLKKFYFSFYDMDSAGGENSGPKGYEVITLHSDTFIDSYTTADTEIQKTTLSDGFVQFKATQRGSGDDNPEDPNNLTPLQQNRGVVFQMKSTDCFEVKLSVDCSGTNCSGGRNFLFAGRADQLLPKCPAKTKSPSNNNYAGGTAKTDCTKKCAYQNGDVHMTSFDGLKWDCQARGVMQTFKGQKGDGSSFQIQTLTNGLEDKQKSVSVTRALLINTGVDGSDSITMSVPNSTLTGCPITIVSGGDKTPIDLSAKNPSFGNNANVMATTSKNGRRVGLKFPTEGVSVNVYVSTNPRFGCYFSTSVCTTNCRWTESSSTSQTSANVVTGLMGGRSDGQTSNDWIKADGTSEPFSTNQLRSSAAYDYCVQNYCLTEAASLFAFPVEHKNYDHYNECSGASSIPYDDTIEKAVNSIEKEDSQKEVVALCQRLFGTDEAMLQECYLEGVVGGKDNVASWTEAEKKMQHDPVPDEVTRIIDQYNAGGSKTRSPGGGVSGDPHFQTWAGVKYDYHGICDLVLLSNPNFNRGLGMDIHIRSKKTKNWSYISTAVVRIGGETFEVAGMHDGNSHWLNTIEVDNDTAAWGEEGETTAPNNNNHNNGVSINGYRIRYKKEDQHHRRYTIDLTNLESIQIKTWKDMVRVDLNNNPSSSSTSKSIFSGSLGLMGSYPDGIMYGRDGTTLFKEELNEFGQEWQVMEQEPKLFRVEQDGPQSPAVCEAPTKETMRRNLAASIVTREDAALSCAHSSNAEFDLCVFDVMAMGSTDVAAGAY